MGIFNRKKKSTSEIIKGICSDIQNLKKNDDSVSFLFLCKTKIKRTTLILGSGEDVYLMIENAASKDENFADLLKIIGEKLSIDDLKNSKENNNDNLITLPDITTNIRRVKHNNVIDEIIKGINSKNNPKE